jgi:hypothetical protein
LIVARSAQLGFLGERFALEEMLPAGPRGLMLFSIVTLGTPADRRYFCVGPTRLWSSLLGPVHWLWALSLTQAGLNRAIDADALLRCRSWEEMSSALATLREKVFALISRLARMDLAPPVSPAEPLPAVICPGGKSAEYIPLD